MKIKIYVEFLPVPIIVVGAGLILYAIAGLITATAYGVHLLVLVLGMALVTTHQGATIDTGKKEFADFYWFWGLKLNHYRQNYDSLETIVLSQTRYSQAYGFVPRLHNQGQLYQGYLKIPGHDSLYLGRSKNKNKLHQKLAALAARLNLSLTDTTKD